MATADMRPMLSVSDVARDTGFHPKQLQRWINKGLLGSWRPEGGRKFYIPQSALETFLEAYRNMSVAEQKALCADSGSADDTSVTGE